MSLALVAKKDFQDASRSKVLWILSVLYVLLISAMVWAFAEFESLLAGGDAAAAAQQGVSFNLYLFMAGATTLFISATALVVSYKAIAGERESGQLKLLLGLPHSRVDVLLGKVIGRTAVLAAPVVLGFAVALLVAFALGVNVVVTEYAIFALLTVLYALVYVSIVVGVSAMASTTTQATAGAISIFVVLEVLWDLVPTVTLFGYYYITDQSLPISPAEYPEWYYVVTRLAPTSAYNAARNAVLPKSASVSIDSSSFLLQDWLGFVVLGLWLVVPLLVGYWRFEAADL
ncbi:ABC transporter permease [Haloarchaeobius sp. FL176]|uniref:ABC transporter permease n=1 Tax=Haloarchaeobius sp. FL176 TaxID=2967129 RepID=UPI002147D150|nr:ABC transporter permease [Haloarchaeobius sp. FL176]